MTALVSIGVAGALAPDTIARIAVATEAAGFHSLWVNDTPRGDALDGLAAAARTTSTLRLATGVLPVDRRAATDIAAAARGLPHERLVLGIGSGQSPVGALARVRAAAAVLRAETRATVLVGALGPRMREVAVTSADGPLLSWLTPAAAAAQSAELHAAAPDTHVALYVRTALDAAAEPRLDAEAALYASFPNYAAHFARSGFTAGDTVIRPAAAGDGVRAYREAADEIVLRAITPGDDATDYEAFIDAASALLSS